MNETIALLLPTVTGATNDVQPLDVPSWLEDFCQDPKWANLTADSAFQQESSRAAVLGFTPCFESIVIMSPVYVIAIVLGVVRLVQLMRFRAQHSQVVGGLLEPNVHLLRLACAFIAFAQPIVVMVYLQYQPEFAAAPFEFVGNSLSCAMWFVAMLVTIYERFVLFRRRGNAIMRFNYTFVFVASCVRFRTVFLLSSLPDRAYYTYSYLPSFFAIFLLFVLAHLHYPRLKDQSTVDEINKKRADEFRQGARSLNQQEFPLATANWLSRLSFGWMTPLVRLGAKRALEDEDVWKLPPEDASAAVVPRFRDAWANQLNTADPSVVAALRSAFGRPFWLATLPKLLNDASQFAGPLILSELVGFARDTSGARPVWQGYGLAVLLFAAIVVGAMGENQYFWMVMQVSVRCRSSLINAIYEKSLIIDNGARREASTGAITNYMSSDAERVAQTITNLHGLMSSPLRIIVALVLLGRELGWATVAGVVSLIVLLPFQAKLVGKAAQYQKLVLGQTDRRLGIVNEVLAGMRVIKFYAWEPAWSEATARVRTEELAYLKKGALFRAVNFMLFSVGPVIVSLVSFAVFAAIGNVLTAEIAFTSLALFNVLRFPLIMLPQQIQGLVEARVSLKRINDFLVAANQPEPDEAAVTALLQKNATTPKRGGSKKHKRAPELAVVVQDGHFEWGDATNTFRLQAINVSIKRGQLVMVLGSTGSGKSSLLAAMLGEMVRLRGQVAVASNVAFAAQSAWIYNDSVKGNILFGLEEERARYERCVQVCSLVRDLELFPAGDETEIGEKGVNLSGGQKQRVNICRAVYSNADIVMLDDPLSALDAHVARAIFNDCIVDYLRDKTRVLVTNQLQFVPQADWIVFM